MIDRRSLLQRAAGLALAPVGAAALAQASAFPNRPLLLLVAFAPGGAGDIVGRRIAREMSRGLGQPVVIENRPAPMAADTATARSKPDGHTLVVTGNGTALTSALFKTMPYDLMKDLAHVSTAATFDLAVIAGAASNFHTIGDVLGFAKTHPGKLTIGTVRLGSTQNLTAEMLKSAVGLDAVIVPFRTTADILSALRTGDIQVAVEAVPPILGQIEGKAVRPLAVASSRRFPGLPQVPTLAESGVPGFDVTPWLGFSVAAGTPPAIVDRLAREVQAAVALPEVQRELQAMGMQARASTPEEITQRLRGDLVRWREVIDKAGIERQ